MTNLLECRENSKGQGKKYDGCNTQGDSDDGHCMPHASLRLLIFYNFTLKMYCIFKIVVLIINFKKLLEFSENGEKSLSERAKIQIIPSITRISLQLRLNKKYFGYELGMHALKVKIAGGLQKLMLEVWKGLFTKDLLDQSCIRQSVGHL